MRYLIIDKKQRVEVSTDATYAVTRLKEELDAIGATYLFATTDDIEISLNTNIEIKILGEDIRNFTHIILRGHRLHKPWEYETKRIIAYYIDEYNRTNPDKKIYLQNQQSIQSLTRYDKLWISKMCIDYGLPIIPTLYKTSGDYETSLPYPYILKDFTGENDLRMIDGKEKIKKNVYLIEKPEDLKQENLINKDLTKYFVQKFIPAGEDIRAFVSKGKCIGGFIRKATEGFMTVNKGEYNSFDPNDIKDIKEMSELVASKFKADFIAVDWMRDENDKLLLLEFSFNPGFKAYETKSIGPKVNIAKAVIESF